MFETTTRTSNSQFAESVVGLIFHIIGSAILYASFAFVAWLLGFGVDVLNAAHPFAPGVVAALDHVEPWLLYIDIVLSGIVLLAGAIRFIIDMR